LFWQHNYSWELSWLLWDIAIVTNDLTYRGYKAVAMRDIATALEMRQASLYYHFPSKEQLFISVRERCFDRHRVGLENAFDRAEKDLRSQLQAAADWFLSQPPLKFLGLIKLSETVTNPAGLQNRA
jgi:AcrR family transcriptional regulator